LRVGDGSAADCEGNRRDNRDHLHRYPRLFARRISANDDTRWTGGKVNNAVTPM
jgi:hypothetical protein